MENATLEGFAIDVSHDEPRPEVEPGEKARTRIAELLKPPETIAGKIRELALNGGREILKEHPHPEMRRIVQTSLGIYLWENMASIHDSGNTLPPGLRVELNEKNKLTQLGFDPEILTRAEYGYVLDALDKQGILEKVKGMQRDQRSEKRDDITDAFREYLGHSPLATFFDTFRVVELVPGVPSRELRDLTVPEQAVLQKRLGEDFERRYARDLAEDELPASLHPSYRRDVLTPPMIATTFDEAPAPMEKVKGDVSRDRFREFVQQQFLLKGGYKGGFVELDRLTTDIIVKNGLFYLNNPDIDYEDDRYLYEWQGFSGEQMARLNDTVYEAPQSYAGRALWKIGPQLYDMTDERDAQTIIDDGLDYTAKDIADEIVRTGYSPLHRFYYYEAYKHILWASAIEGPLYTDADDAVEAAGNHYFKTPIGGLMRSAYELDLEMRWEGGTLKYMAPDVLPGIPRLITRTDRNKNLPLLPSSATDLVLEATNSDIAGRSGTGYPDNGDPAIAGMKLVARDGATCYFMLDKDHDPYEPSQYELSYIRRRKAADFCKEIGMHGLAEQIDSFDTLTIGQLVSLMRQHVRYAAPEQRKYYQFYDQSEWQELVGSDGVLEGQSAIFARFTEKLFSSLFSDDRFHKEEWKVDIYTLGGFALDNPKAVVVERHVQARIKIPKEDVDILIDIAPDGSQLWEAVAAAPKTPPPPPPPLEYTPRPPAKEREYVDKRPEVTILNKTEFKELLDTSIGKILFAEGEVFEQAGLRLFRKVARDASLPAYEDLPASVEETVVLGIRTSGDELSDADHDPAIAGMKLIARDGDKYFYSVDPDSPDYKPVLDPIPTQVQNELAITCLRLKMVGLAEEIQTAEHLTYEGFRQLVRSYCKYTIPEEEGKSYRYSRIFDFEDEIDEDGLLRGQCTTFEGFMRKLSEIAGYQAEAESGYVLANDKNISQAGHRQTRLKKHKALIDVDPLYQDIPDLGGEPVADIKETDHQIIIKKLTDEDIEAIIGDIMAGRSWPEKLQSKPRSDIDVSQLPDEDIERFGQMFFDSLLAEKKANKSLLKRIAKALKRMRRPFQKQKRPKVKTVADYVAEHGDLVSNKE